VRVLVSAYACEPGRGSEPSVGWNWAREIATHHDVWVLTRANNQQSIEAELRRHPEPRMRFLYLDLPPWMRRWKRGQRGIRLYAYSWQVAARRAAREAHRRYRFDLVHHVTFASAVTPALTFLPDVGFVWGPVGGAVRPPWRLVCGEGFRALAYETAREARKIAARYVDPFVRSTWQQADLILVQNRDTLAWLPSASREKALVWPNAGVPEAEVGARTRPEREHLLVATAGRLIGWKGFSLAVRAVAAAGPMPIRLVVAGEGPDRARLERLGSRLGIADRISYPGWLSRADLLHLFEEADVFLFPSLHEECGFVVVEAMAKGAIPIVLDIGAPQSLVGHRGYVVRTRNQSRKDVVNGLADALRDAWRSRQDPRRHDAAIARARSMTWSARMRALERILGSEGHKSMEIAS